MPVLLAVGHGRDQVFISFYPCLGEVLADLGLPICCLVLAQAKALLQIVADFSHDLLSPFGQIESRAGSKTQQCICQGHWNEDAGIENSREGCCHSSWPPSGNLFFSYKPVSKA